MGRHIVSLGQNHWIKWNGIGEMSFHSKENGDEYLQK